MSAEAMRGASESPEDAALVVAVASGARTALAQLYDRHAAALLGLGIRILRSRRDAEDIVHDVFLEVWRRAHSYDPTRASVRGWLLLMMRCRSLDRRKSSAFALTAPLDAVDEDAIAARTESTALRTGDAVDHRRAVAALAALPGAQREVLILGYFEGLSSSEIAAELSIPIGTVKSRVAAGMRTLREQMGVDEKAESSRGGGRSAS